MRTRPDRFRRGPVGPRVRPTDNGMATAELVVVLPAIVLALMIGIAAIAAMSARLRCGDAAQTAARLAARGETLTEVVAAARSVAPPGAVVRVSRSNGEVEVTVRAVAGLPVVGGLLPAITVDGSFSQPVEPGPPP